MGVKPHVQKTIFLVWLLLVPAGMWFTYQAYPPQFSGNWLKLLAFLVLTVLVAAMPIMINHTPIFLIQWVALATFLTFGLFIELVISQIAVVALFIKIRLPKEQLFRLPFNLMMFFIVSFVSGAAYYGLGGQTAPSLSTDTKALWLAVFYAVLYYFVNQIIVSFNFYYIYKRKEAFFGKDFFVETLTTVITLPIGIVLYILFKQVGLLAILFVGLPFVSVSLIFQLYYSSQKINHYLQDAAEIGHQMAERLRVDDVINLFIQKLGEMLPVDYAYIFEKVGDELKLSRRIESGEGTYMEMPPLKKGDGICGLVWDKQEALIFSAKKDWQQKTKGYLPDDTEAILCVPIIRNKKVIGILLLASRTKRAYEKYQLTIVDILCSYFAVAMENAKHYERTKNQSERCALTNLYNYRYFEELLHKEFERLTRFEHRMLSLIILDIDHFKTINDTYGHQSGNEILRDIANRISKLVATRGTVARYGGEEFVVLLPDISKEEASQIAEQIRQSIANWPFILYQALDQEQKKIQVKVTVSIGVATAPEDAEDSLALVRHADRALYIGAKQAGRNRVAEYTSH
ncbi:sensor domain-containing diguanylate cyclase [Neobacillus niacini]|uniref:sensor domain-containing diguanylate cyclase n=1 Tax=Neobacillus niacini TaxID=86668 RepID=UPI0021CB78C3|nr:sensor domain-containing diguanylate cyclase [Neobacillus niacini]MCM3765460.1 sensor domain-containing diguanylate cyclase [Neobacillus niacini]